MTIHSSPGMTARSMAGAEGIVGPPREGEPADMTDAGTCRACADALDEAARRAMYAGFLEQLREESRRKGGAA